MIKKTTIMILSVVIILLAACKPQAGPSNLSAALSELKGKVDIKQAGSETYEPASSSTTLGLNGNLQTGDDGRVRLDLSTGTIIRVAPSSIFTLVSNEEVDGSLATNIKLEVGKIFIILNGGSTDVETPSGVASVRGSYMKVEVDPLTNDVYVTCLEGQCSATNPAGTVNFTQGQKTILFHQDPETGNWTIPGVEDMTPEDFEEWLNENPEAKELFDQAMATVTALAVPPTATATSTPAIESALPPAGSSDACFDIIEPPAGSGLPFQGLVNFQWEEQSGAQSYVLTFTDRNGNTVAFETAETSMEKYIEILPNAGEYSWSVTAFGNDGSEICSTEPATFDKPDSKWEPEKPKQEEEQDPAACDPQAQDYYCCLYPLSCY